MRKYRIKQTSESSSIENKDNSPYEQQRLKTRFSPIKIGKTKHVLGKTV